LKVESCGVTQTFNGPPTRAVTLTSTATETMLELGLQDHMVGTAYLRQRTIGPQYAKAYAKVPVLSAEQPSMEKLLSVNPDFVYAGYGDGFSEDTGHTRQQLQDLKINTYLSPVGCTDAKKTISDEPKDIATVGKIFNVNDRAQKSIDKFNSKVKAVEDKVKGAKRPKVFLYNSGTDAPMTVGGWAYASAMMDAAGGTNIFADKDLRWGKVSWEQVAQADPDIIVIYDYVTPSPQQKIGTLKKTPALANVSAIKNNRFVVISLSLAQPGPRSAEGVEVLAKGFHPDRFNG
jgi:iron complex transport system substrate-binding protein